MWDVRARCTVYELATGNNNVSALAWDSGRSTLYASTECTYIDRMGYNHDYRRARVPGQREGATHHDGDGSSSEDEEDYDDDDLEGDEKLWPDRAFHAEDYFGYMFDAGDHRICKCFMFACGHSPDFPAILQSNIRLRKILIPSRFPHTGQPR